MLKELDTIVSSDTKKAVVKEVLSQVKSGIDMMKGKTYKMNGLDSFTPTFLQISNIADCFDLEDAGFSINDWLGQEFEDGEEAKQDYADYYEDPDALGFKPSEKDVANAKKMFNYLDANFSDTEILDTYNFSTPRPLTYKDIMKVFNSFKKGMLNANITTQMIKSYNNDVKGLSVINWAD